jgi:hypothetical protein|tara:strand:+ start:141 stop:284 length:144 start_codon:yes stop_codon:yes gene_type:complete
MKVIILGRCGGMVRYVAEMAFRKFLSELFLIFGYEDEIIKLDKSWEN